MKHRRPMRLILIISLLIASIGFALPLSAQPQKEHAAHRTMGHGEHHGTTHEDGKTQALTHICPGCALVGQPVVAEEEEIIPAIPRWLENSPSVRSFNANPIPPPPRFS